MESWEWTERTFNFNLRQYVKSLVFLRFPSRLNCYTCSTIYNPGQNVLGHLRKLDKKTHFAKWTHILPLKKAVGCCYKGLFLLSPSPPSSVDCVELKLECITSTLHRGGRGEGRCLNLTSYCVSVPRVLTRVVDVNDRFKCWELWQPGSAINQGHPTTISEAYLFGRRFDI